MHIKNSKNKSFKKDISFKCKQTDTYWNNSISKYDPSDLKKFNTDIIAKVKSMTESKNINNLKLNTKHSISDFVLKDIL